MQSASQIGLFALCFGGIFILAFLTCLLLLRLFTMKRVPAVREGWVVTPMEARPTYQRYANKTSQTSTVGKFHSQQSVRFL